MPIPDQDDVTILIADKEFAAWPSIDIHLRLDSFSSVDFTAPFESGRLEFREIFRPFTYKPVEVRVASPAGGATQSAAILSGAAGGNPDTVFKGTMLGIIPDNDPEKSVVAVSAYAVPGVLNDCDEPGNSVPIEFQDLTIKAIAESLTEPFNIDVDFRAPEGPVFDKVKLDVERKIFDFLSDLARQRNIVISNTTSGDLLCWQSIQPGSPRATLRDDEQPNVKVTAAFNPQQYFSEITGFVMARKKRKGKPKRSGSKYTERNPRLTDVLRPMSFKLGDTEDAGAPEATRAKMGRMFGLMASYEVDVATWRDPKGKLWEPNTTITLLAPDAMIYTETEFLIRSVDLHQDAENSSAKLGVVLPGAFSGEFPERFPWD